MITPEEQAGVNSAVIGLLAKIEEQQRILDMLYKFCHSRGLQNEFKEFCNEQIAEFKARQ